MQRVVGPAADPTSRRTWHARAADDGARHDDQRRYDDADEQAIRELIKRKPDATLAEVAEAMGKAVHPGTVSRTLTRLNLPRKKSPRTPPNKTGRT